VGKVEVDEVTVEVDVIKTTEGVEDGVVEGGVEVAGVNEVAGCGDGEGGEVAGVDVAAGVDDEDEGEGGCVEDWRGKGTKEGD
jgi:hypothetical protein